MAIIEIGITVRVRRSIVSLVTAHIIAGSLLVGTASAAEAKPGPTVKLRGETLVACQVELCTQPSAGNQVTFDYKGPKGSLRQVHLTVGYGTSDPLDPGDEITILLASDVPGVGHVNLGVVPVCDRTITLDSDWHPELVDLFEDGKQKRVKLFANRGSVHVTKVTVALVR